jgi:hypothetical protein
MLVKKKVLNVKFLNVDLDVYSRSDLQPLVSGFGDKVFALYVGRERGTYSANLELAGYEPSADSTIRTFCELVRALPKTERAMWNAAKRREFNVGLQAGLEPLTCDEFRIETQTLKAVAELGGVIVLSVYGPERAKRRNVSK